MCESKQRQKQYKHDLCNKNECQYYRCAKKREIDNKYHVYIDCDTPILISNKFVRLSQDLKYLSDAHIESDKRIDLDGFKSILYLPSDDIHALTWYLIDLIAENRELKIDPKTINKIPRNALDDLFYILYKYDICLHKVMHYERFLKFTETIVKMISFHGFSKFPRLQTWRDNPPNMPYITKVLMDALISTYGTNYYDEIMNNLHDTSPFLHDYILSRIIKKSPN